MTFELTLKGTAPSSVAFGAFFDTCPPDARCPFPYSGVGFCATADMTNVQFDKRRFETVPHPMCEDGKVYRITVAWNVGDPLRYWFHGHFKGEDGNVATEYFLRGTEIVRGDVLISAVYDLGDSDEQQDGRMPEAPPDVGGGGMSGQRPPSGTPTPLAVGGSSIAYRR